jgi:hypothetical protein
MSATFSSLKWREVDDYSVANANENCYGMTVQF